MSTPTSNSKRRQIPGAGKRAQRSAQDPQARESVQQKADRANSNERGFASLQRKVSAQLATPQLNYKVLMVVTACLTVLGLIMVLSSSMVTSYASGASVFGEFIKQAMVVVIGLVVMWFALRMRPETVRKYSPSLLVIAILMLIAVLIPGIGVGGDEVGSNSWIRIGPIGVQPSEVAKLALAVWGAATVSYRARATQRLNTGLGAFIAISAVIMLLVLFQKDLGMMFSVGIVVAALMFFAGVDKRVFFTMLGSVALLGVFAISRKSFRGARITTWKDALTLNFGDTTTQGAAYQSHQGILSLSDGGLFGAGLGQSRAKWFYLPEAKNDFIFAIVGEEQQARRVAVEAAHRENALFRSRFHKVHHRFAAFGVVGRRDEVLGLIQQHVHQLLAVEVGFAVLHRVAGLHLVAHFGHYLAIHSNFAGGN